MQQNRIDPNLKIVMSNASRMVGRVLDVIDASYGDDIQRQKIKKLIQPALYDFRNECMVMIEKLDSNGQTLVQVNEDQEIVGTVTMQSSQEYVENQPLSEGEAIRARMRAKDAQRVDTGADPVPIQQATETTPQVQETRSGPVSMAQIEEFARQGNKTNL
tara:strand:- start:511 stop:990 length:480 start_codon:yes stop_codon:yes gene_type:complete